MCAAARRWKRASSSPVGGGNVIRRKGLGGKAVYPKAALCPVCGEVSIYADEEQLEKLKK